MACELCGKNAELLRAVVEGTELNVCEQCAKFGKIIGRLRKEPEKKPITKSKEKEKLLSIIPNYGKLIKQKREQLGLKQEELAKRISEKESIIHKIEVHAIEPSIDLAKKLERFLSIKLVEEKEEEPSGSFKSKKSELTIGDFVKVRQR